MTYRINRRTHSRPPREQSQGENSFWTEAAFPQEEGDEEGTSLYVHDAPVSLPNTVGEVALRTTYNAEEDDDRPIIPWFLNTTPL